MTEETEVLVVGAGPTGLTAAAGLLQRGIRVRVIDKAERANPHSKAIVIWPRAMEAFDCLGVGEDVFDAGVKIHGTNNYTGGRRVGGFRMKPLTGTRFPLAVSLPQSLTERFLRGAVERLGGQIEFGRRVTSVRQTDDGVLAETEDGEAIRASWVIGADGAHSTVREQVGVSFEGSPYPQTFVLVDGEYDTDCRHDESYYMLGPSGVVVVVGLPGGLYRVFASIAPGQEVGDVEETVARIAAERSPVRLEQVKAHGSGAFQIQARMADRLRVGRVLLIGDAAHVHSPAGGLGLNTGVEDAHALSWRLAGALRGTSPVSELDGWEKERTLVARGIIAETDRQTKMWMLTGWKRVQRDLGIQFRTRTGIAKRVLPRRMAMLDAVLPVAGPRLKEIAPGGRLHNAPIGGDRQLRDLLRAGGHLLLVFSDRPAPVLDTLGLPGPHHPGELRVAAVSPTAAGAPGPAGVVQITDTGNRVRRAVHAPADSVLLVRPDGLIAAAIATSDTAALRTLRARLGGLRVLEGDRK